jgi:DNA processing protein
LYVRWDLKEFEEYFSIVWSRKISEYAKKVWAEIIPKLTKYFNIVSWWASWCDTLAHKLALKNGWKTIVVFWTWIDLVFPSFNEKIFEEVLEKSGALVSIFPIWTPGNIYTFPVRNEIVAWMSSGVLVLQAGEKSGTLITANLALDQWKDIFAIPWDIFNPDFIWTNDLIKNWNAKLVSKTDDILEEYNYKIIKEDKKIEFKNEIEENIFNLLKYNLSLSIDDFLEKTKYDYGEISLNISMMEISGTLKKDLFGKYSINY